MWIEDVKDDLLGAAPDASRGNDRGKMRALVDRVRQQARALDALQRSHDELARKVAALQNQADQALVGVLREFAGLDRRVQDVSTQVATARRSVASPLSTAMGQTRHLNAMARAAQLQQVTNVVNTAQATAFGQRGSVFARNNLLLAGNQLLWTFIDPLLKTMGIVKGVEPSVAAYLAPLASLL